MVCYGFRKGYAMPRPRRKDRATFEEIEAMPALIDTEDVARITGYTTVYAAKLCRKGGILADCAVKTGTTWSINKAKALEALGLR